MGRQERIRLAEDGISMRGAEGSRTKLPRARRRAAGPHGAGNMMVQGAHERRPTKLQKRQGEGQRPPAGGAAWWWAGAVGQRWSNAGSPGMMEGEVQQHRKKTGAGRSTARAGRNGAAALPRFGRAAGRRGGWVCAGRVGEGVGSAEGGRQSRNEAVWRDPGRHSSRLAGAPNAMQAAVPPRTNTRAGGRGGCIFVKRGAASPE